MPASLLLHPLLLAEPYATSVFIVVFAMLLGASVLFSRTTNRLGVPVVLLFLFVGMLGGSEGIGGIQFGDYAFAMRIGTIALILILFDGGLNTSVTAIRNVLYPASLLATVGVVLTAGILAVFAWLIGLPWPQALLLGAVVSSTDTAAVLAVLRGSRMSLRPRVGQLLEVESCINDPMAVILTTSLIAWFQTPADANLGRLLLAVPVQMISGAAVGVACGYGAKFLLHRAGLITLGLYPVLTLAIALFSFGTATLLWGSGFLAVFVCGVIVGGGGLPYHSALARVHDAFAWLSQITLFVMLGLLVYPSRLPGVALVGLGLGLFLALVARPLAVWLCLLPFRKPLSESAYVGWIGLRGAVPIVLATFPILAGVAESEHIFNLVFFIVVVTSIFPGSTIRWTTQRLGMGVPEKPVPAAAMEMVSAQTLDGSLTSFYIGESLAVSGAMIQEIEFPSNSSVVLVVRGKELLPAKGNTRLLPGDHVYVFYREQDRSFIELLFGRPEE
jgi:cell volume regulation protein A